MTIHACTLDIPLYMHSSNILLDAHLSAKIGDFGFTTEGTVVEGRTLVTAVSLAKTLGYSAPEKDTGRHSPKNDLFSYGCCNCSLLYFHNNLCLLAQIVLETLSRQLPYSLKIRRCNCVYCDQGSDDIIFTCE